MGRLDEVERLYRRQLACQPESAEQIKQLGWLYQNMGKYPAAEKHLQRALSIFRKKSKKLPPNFFWQPNYQSMADVHKGLGVVYAAMGQVGRSVWAWRRWLSIQSKSVRSRFLFETTSNSRRSEFDVELGMILSLAIQTRTTRAVETAFNALLCLKDIGQDQHQAYRAQITRSTDPNDRARWNRYVDAKRRHATLSLAGPGKLSPYKYQELLGKAHSDTLQFLFGSYSKADETLRRIDSSLLSRKLSASVVLLEIARTHIFRFKATGGQPRWDPEHYLAFVLRRGQRPVIIDLGEAHVIDAEIKRLRHSIMRAPQEVVSLGDERLAERHFKSLARRLYDRLLLPVQKQLRPRDRLVISPVGELNLLPFEILVGPRGKYLVEERAVRYVSTGRDLLLWRTKPWRPRTSDKAVVMGDPDYGTSPKADTSGPFSRLPATGVEAREVASSLQGARLFLRRMASERTLRESGRVSVLHLATHGFFHELAGPSRIESPSAALKERSSSRRRLARVQNPMLRSGLALAGANQSSSESPVGGRLDDGILTAEEVATLDLVGTELVVLSACETGIGEVKRGGGVYGLRRGFELAGTRSIVMSLWKVPDAETRELMRAFYTRLKAGKGKGRALRESMLEQIRRRRSRNGGAHPYFWGAFILAGDPM
ncbi:MAG: CHAT domain-containing tetratricopeptide repeat protein, partial [Planctomycetota bacterium]